MPTLPVYTPSRSLKARVSRRLVKHTKIRPFSAHACRPIVSFSFDDCPRSVVENAFPLLDAQGWSSTLYIAMGLCNHTNHLGLHMSEEDVVKAHKAGHEIGNHSFSHMDARAVTTPEFQDDIAKNEAAFRALGIPKTSTFAYPYGEVTAASKQALSNHFALMRGIHSPTSMTTYDLNQAGSQRLYSGIDVENTISAIERLSHTKGWLIIFTHDVRENPSDYGCTPDELSRVIQAASKIQADVMTVDAALKTMGGSV